MENPGMSLVIPVFNMRAYLPDLLASLSSQLKVPCPVEIIFVDDGSTDGGDELIEEWITRSLFTCRIIHQSNGGVSRARNTGLDVATGDWVTFPDADDILSPRYIAEAWKFLTSARGRRATIVASRVRRIDDRTRQVSDDHPLRFRFENGPRVVDMRQNPDFFQLHAASTFFRRADLERTGARFPEGIAASEDAMFIIEQLAATDVPMLGLCPAAEYLYRRRPGDSTIDRYMSAPVSAYLERFGTHYREHLAQAADRTGTVPRWMQSMLLYELHWALGPWERPRAKRPAVSQELGELILDAFAACCAFIDDRAIIEYDATALSVQARLVLLALKGSPLPGWVPLEADGVDVARKRTRWRKWELAGATDRSAASADVRNVVYFAPSPLCERFEWRSGIVDDVLRERAPSADWARRRVTGQRALALASRATDMRVRRVRFGGSRIPGRALLTLMKEWLRRRVLSRSHLNAALASIAALPLSPVLVAIEDVPYVTTEAGEVVQRLEKGSFSSLRAAISVRRATRIVANDPFAAAELRKRTRPRASQWNLQLHMQGVGDDHDVRLAVVEARARSVEY